MQLFSADPKIFSKKNLISFYVHKNFKNRPHKLLIIGPDAFISQSSPVQTPAPSPELTFHIKYEISGPDIFSLICG